MEEERKLTEKFEPKARVFESLLDDCDLLPLDKKVIRRRFIAELNTTEIERHRMTVLSTLGATFVQIGGLVVPALLSITHLDRDSTLFWSTWATSLAVGISTNLLAHFRIGEKAALLTQHSNRLISEGYKFFGLSSPYLSQKHGDVVCLFLTRIERIVQNEQRREVKFMKKQSIKKKDSPSTSPSRSSEDDKKEKLAAAHSRLPSPKQFRSVNLDLDTDDDSDTKYIIEMNCEGETKQKDHI